MARRWQEILEGARNDPVFKDWGWDEEALELYARGLEIIEAGPTHPKYEQFTSLVKQAARDIPEA